jgi:hypothetical protein
MRSPREGRKIAAAAGYHKCLMCQVLQRFEFVGSWWCDGVVEVPMTGASGGRVDKPRPVTDS